MAILDRLMTGKTVSLSAAGGLEAAGGAPAARTLNLNMQRQLQTNWCWAAVSASVRKFYTPASPITQCDVANKQLSTKTCCVNGSSATCNKPWFLDKALTGVKALNAMSSGALSYVKVQGQINNNRPLGCRIGWNAGGGHFVCIDGYNAAGNYVTVRDPWYGTSTTTYANFSTNYRSSGKWTHSYTTKP